MQNNSKINTVLLVIIIVLLGMLLFSNKKTENVLGQKTDNQQQIEKTTTDSYVPPVVKKEKPKAPTAPSGNSVLQTIFNQYKNGMISECTENGKTYYTAVHNVYDGGGKTFDATGKVVGEYQGMTGKYTGVNPKNCTQIYVVSPNIWGYAGVNVYNLK